MLVKLSSPSIVESEYIGIKNTVPNLSGSFLKKCEDGFYLMINFMETRFLGTEGRWYGNGV